MAMLFALTLPGLVVLLVAVAALERFGRWCGRNWLPWRRGRPPASATGFDELTACFYAGKRIELEQRRTELVLRVDQHNAAPPGSRIEFCDGVAIYFQDPTAPHQVDGPPPHLSQEISQDRGERPTAPQHGWPPQQ